MTLFFHIIIGGFMITNPALFATYYETGVGFVMPTLPVNPGDELRSTAGITESESSELKELADDPKTKIIEKFAERMQFFHQ